VLGAQARERRFTFAVVGRNESRTLAGVIAEAQRAAGPEDRVLYADSASEDDSVSIAFGLGIEEVIRAPRGKGRAMQAVLDRCSEGWVCFLDADLLAWERSIPQTLRTAALSSGCQMVIGEYTCERRRMVTPSIYWPLVDRLFPKYGRRCDPRPLSGLRAIDASLRLGPLPSGYGAETYLNLAVAAAGHRIAVANLGEITEPLRGYSNVEEIATAVSDAILDFAIAQERIASASRPHWEQWARGVIELLAQPPSPGAPDAEFRAALDAAVARALPPTKTPRSTPDPSRGLRARRAVR
jgi:Glycosyl transferase family 2